MERSNFPRAILAVEKPDVTTAQSFFHEFLSFAAGSCWSKVILFCCSILYTHSIQNDKITQYSSSAAFLYLGRRGSAMCLVRHIGRHKRHCCFVPFLCLLARAGLGKWAQEAAAAAAGQQKSHTIFPELYIICRC
jgi:hypothetical protein